MVGDGKKPSKEDLETLKLLLGIAYLIISIAVGLKALFEGG